MFAAIGNLLGRKAAPTPTLARIPAPSSSATASRRRYESPRDIYARVFRWKAPAEFSETAVSVEIVGSFTRWLPVPLAHDRIQDMWTATIQEIQGKRTHHYVLLINGKPVYDPACDGLAVPMGFDEEQYALQTEKGPRVLMLFAQTK